MPTWEFRAASKRRSPATVTAIRPLHRFAAPAAGLLLGLQGLGLAHLVFQRHVRCEHGDTIDAPAQAARPQVPQTPASAALGGVPPAAGHGHDCAVFVEVRSRLALTRAPACISPTRPPDLSEPGSRAATRPASESLLSVAPSQGPPRPA